MPGIWNKETYEASVSSRCWWYTAWDHGWGRCAQYGSSDLSGDEDLRQIVAMEEEMGPVPEWACRIVEGPVNFLPACGHCRFPQAYLEAVDAIGSEIPPAFIHGCYTCDSARKMQMEDYLLCLDAWFAGAAPEDVAVELSSRQLSRAEGFIHASPWREPDIHSYQAETDWSTITARLWQVLGPRTSLKDHLVERIIHRQRWWIKTLVWHDDSRNRFGRDRYLGNIGGSGDTYGNPFRDPYFAELEVPRIRALVARLEETCPDWPWFKEKIENSWLCAPKAFRFLERLLWAVGRERALDPGEDVPAYLDIDGTFPDHEDAAAWWREYLNSLREWWQDEQPQTAVGRDIHRRLGERTPIKCWLSRLFVRRLEMHEQCADVRRLVHPESGCKRGMRIIDRTASPIPPLVDFSAITDDVPISDTERARLRAEPDPRAVAARYDRGRNVIVVVLGSGLELSVSRNHFPSLRRASSEELDQVTVAPRGGVLVWHNLDEHYSVRALVGDLLGG